MHRSSEAQWCRCCGERRPGCMLLADAFRPDVLEECTSLGAHICPQCHEFAGNLMRKLFIKDTQDKLLKYWSADSQIALPKSHIFVQDRKQSILDSTSSDYKRKAESFVPYVPGLVVEYLSERWLASTNKTGRSANNSSSESILPPHQANASSGALSKPSSAATIATASGAGAGGEQVKSICDTVDAVILMADVTGYTALAETFCELRGVNAGVEAVVTNCLNKYFTRLIETVNEFGGDVVKFAGDAVLCVWKPQISDVRRSNGSSPRGAKQQRQQLMESYAQAATLCAYKAKSLVERVRVGDEEKVLRLHCGLACGRVSIISVGGGDAVSKREIVLTGEALRLAGVAVDLAAPETVVVGEQVWRYVRTIAICTRVSNADLDEKIGKTYGAHDLVAASAAAGGAIADENVPENSFKGGLENESGKQSRSALSHPEHGNAKPRAGGGLGPGTASRLPAFYHVEELTVQPVLDTRSRRHSSNVSTLQAMLPPIDLLLGVLESYIPAHIIKQMKGRQKIHNDVRLVSVLFMNIGNEARTFGYETDLDQLELMQEIFSHAQRIVNHHEGMIRQFIVDDKGCVLIVCFGVSTHRHKDDAARAIATALDLQLSIAKMQPNKLDHEDQRIKTAIGVTTGRAFCGPIGSQVVDGSSMDLKGPERREWSVVGHCVNLAARLMNVAYKRDEGILCDETTAENVRLSVTYQHSKRGPAFLQVDSVHVKGLKDKVPLFKPMRMTERKSNSFLGSSQSHAGSVGSMGSLVDPDGPNAGPGGPVSHLGKTEMDPQALGDTVHCFGRKYEKNAINPLLFAFTKGIIDPFILIHGEEGMGKTNLLEWARAEISSNEMYDDIKLLGWTPADSRSLERVSYYGALGEEGSRTGTYAGENLGIGIEGLRGFLCDLFHLPRKSLEGDQEVLAKLIDRLQVHVEKLAPDDHEAYWQRSDPGNPSCSHDFGESSLDRRDSGIRGSGLESDSSVYACKHYSRSHEQRRCEHCDRHREEEAGDQRHQRNERRRGAGKHHRGYATSRSSEDDDGDFCEGETSRMMNPRKRTPSGGIQRRQHVHDRTISAFLDSGGGNDMDRALHDAHGADKLGIPPKSRAGRRRSLPSSKAHALFANLGCSENLHDPRYKHQGAAFGLERVDAHRHFMSDGEPSAAETKAKQQLHSYLSKLSLTSGENQTGASATANEARLLERRHLRARGRVSSNNSSQFGGTSTSSSFSDSESDEDDIDEEHDRDGDDIDEELSAIDDEEDLEVKHLSSRTFDGHETSGRDAHKNKRISVRTTRSADDSVLDDDAAVGAVAKQRSFRGGPRTGARLVQRRRINGDDRNDDEFAIDDETDDDEILSYSDEDDDLDMDDQLFARDESEHKLTDEEILRLHEAGRRKLHRSKYGSGGRKLHRMRGRLRRLGSETRNKLRGQDLHRHTGQRGYGKQRKQRCLSQEHVPVNPDRGQGPQKKGLLENRSIDAANRHSSYGGSDWHDDFELSIDDSLDHGDELANQRRLNRQVLHFRYNYPLIAAKVDETTIRVFLSSQAEDLAQCIVHVLATATGGAAQSEGIRLDQQHFDDELSSSKDLSGTDALITEVLSLVVMLALEQVEHKVCITLDDLEWADELSTTLLRSIVGPQCPGVMVIATMRSSALDRIQKRMRLRMQESPFVYPFELQPLRQSEIEDLLKHVFEIPSWPSDIIKRVMSSCNGLPLWAIEYVRGMLANKHIRRDEATGTWTFDEDMEEVFSDGLEGAILQRFDNLREEVQYAFIWACVLEADFTVSMLRDLILYTDVNDKLDELIKFKHIAAIHGARSDRDEQLYRKWDDINISLRDEDLQQTFLLCRNAKSRFTVHDIFCEKLKTTDNRSFERLIDDLLRERFIVPSLGTPLGPEQKMYRVAHDYYYRAVYKMIPPREVERHHQLTARCLSAMESEYIEPLLAHHYRKAKDDKNAIRCLYKTACTRHKNEQIHQACGYLLDAVHLVSQTTAMIDVDDVATMKLMLANLLLYLGRHHDARVYLLQMDEMLGLSGNASREALEGQGDWISMMEGSAPAGGGGPPTVGLSSAGILNGGADDAGLGMPPAMPAPVLASHSSFRRLYRSRVPRANTAGSAQADEDASLASLSSMSTRRRRRGRRTGQLPHFHSSSSSSTSSHGVPLPAPLDRTQSADASASSLPTMSVRMPQRRGSSGFGRPEEVGATSPYGKPRSASTPGIAEGGFLDHSDSSSLVGRPRAGSSRTTDTDLDSVDTALDSVGTDYGRPMPAPPPPQQQQQRARLPSLKRMCSTSLFHPRSFFATKAVEAREPQFLTQNMFWVRTQALLLQTMYYGMDHDKFVFLLKDFVSVLLEHSVPKESGLVQFVAYVAHAVSPKYSKMKPNFSLETVAQLASGLNAIEGLDTNFLVGVLYEVSALAFLSKAAFTQTQEALQQAQSYLRASGLMKFKVYRKHLLECKLMAANVAMQRGRLVEAERSCREVAETFARVSQSPQVLVWSEAWSTLARFRRYGLLVTLSEITSYEESAAATMVAASAAAAAAAGRLAMKTGGPGGGGGNVGGGGGGFREGRDEGIGGVDAGEGGGGGGGRRSNSRRQSLLKRSGSGGDLHRLASVNSVPMPTQSRSPRYGVPRGDGQFDMEVPARVDHLGDERLMRVDQVLWAALRAWKLGDRNSPGYSRSEATYYATAAWNMLVDAAQTPLVWYLGMAYEILFYGLVQIVHFRPPSSLAASAGGKSHHNHHHHKRLSAAVTFETVKHLCKSFKTFAETFPAARPVSCRCKGIANLLRGKPAKAASCFRKAVKAATKLKMVYEACLSGFLLHTHCAEALTRHDSGFKSTFADIDTSKSFTVSFNLTLETWRSGARSSTGDLVRVLTAANSDSLSPSRRSVSNSAGLELDGAFAARLRRRSSSSRHSGNAQHRPSAHHGGHHPVKTTRRPLSGGHKQPMSYRDELAAE